MSVNQPSKTKGSADRTELEAWFHDALLNRDAELTQFFADGPMTGFSIHLRSKGNWKVFAPWSIEGEIKRRAAR